MCAPPPSDFLGGSQELFPTQATAHHSAQGQNHKPTRAEVFVPAFAALPAAPCRPALLAPVEILN
jgi:hypothetical protein